MEYKSPWMALIPIIVMIFWILDINHLLRKPELHFPAKKRSGGLSKWIWRGLLFSGILSFCLIAYALMGPRLPRNLSESEIEVNDIFLVFDTSRSMSAVDFEPNRLEAAKSKMKEFVSMMPTDRIGIVIFSEQVFTLLPLTTDLSLVSEMIGKIRMGPLGSGTNIGDAIGLAAARAAQSEAKNKIIILLTDGVSQVGNLTPLQAAEEANDLGIKIYSIAVGGDKDAKMPIGKSLFGTRYQTIPGGSIDFEVLQKMADISGGKAFIARDSNSLKDIFQEISSLEKTKIKSFAQTVYKELFYPYLLIGILLLLFVEGLRLFVLKEVGR